MPEPTARKALIAPLVAALEAERAPTERLLTAAGLPLDFDQDSDGEFLERHLWHALDLAARTLDYPDFGSVAGARATLDDLGPFGRRLRRSLTLFDLLHTFSRTVRSVSSHARFWLVRSNGTTWFAREGMRNLSGFDRGRNEAEDWTLMFMQHLVRIASRPDWRPAQVWLQRHRRGADGAWTASPGTEVRYGQPHTAIAIPSQFLARPLGSSALPPALNALQGCVRSRLRVGQPPTIREAAALSSLSVRTLQRRLDNDGLTYSRLIDRVRFELATDRLRDSDAPVLDIALDLEYSDPAHFTRAFRRWTGLPPQAWRRQLRPDAAAKAGRPSPLQWA